MKYGARTVKMFNAMDKRKFMSSMEIADRSGLSYQWIAGRLCASTDIVEIKKIRHPDRNRYVKVYRLI